MKPLLITTVGWAEKARFSIFKISVVLVPVYDHKIKIGEIFFGWHPFLGLPLAFYGNASNCTSTKY